MTAATRRVKDEHVRVESQNALGRSVFENRLDTVSEGVGSRVAHRLLHHFHPGEPVAGLVETQTDRAYSTKQIEHSAADRSLPPGSHRLKKALVGRRIDLKERVPAQLKLQMAELLAPKLGDRTLFKEQLQAVLDTPLDAIPTLAPEQLIEKHKAKARTPGGY